MSVGPEAPLALIVGRLKAVRDVVSGGIGYRPRAIMFGSTIRSRAPAFRGAPFFSMGFSCGLFLPYGMVGHGSSMDESCKVAAATS